MWLRCLWVWLFYFPLFGFSQILPNNIGKSYFSGTGICSNDAFSVFNNSSQLLTDQYEIGLFAKNYFSVSGTQQAFASTRLPIRYGTLGLGLSHFGDELHNESNFIVGFGKKLSTQLSLGASVTYFTKKLVEQERVGTIYPEISTSFQINESFCIASSFQNPFGQKLSKSPEQDLLSRFTIGSTYQPNEKIKTGIQFVLDNQSSSSVSLGLDYKINPILEFQIGGQFNPGFIQAGISANLSKFDIGTGGQYNQLLGLSPAFSAQKIW